MAPVVVLGGRRRGAFGGTAASNDSVEAALDEARDAMRRRAWDAPPVHNFKDVTDAAVARWPTSAALADLRREAAERLVADALGRKYANDLPEATHLAALALHFDPQHTTAQHLSAELAGARAPPTSRRRAAPAHCPRSRQGPPRPRRAFASPIPEASRGRAEGSCPSGQPAPVSPAPAPRPRRRAVLPRLRRRTPPRRSPRGPGL